MVHDMIFYLCGGYGIVDEYLSALCTYDGDTNILYCTYILIQTKPGVVLLL